MTRFAGATERKPYQQDLPLPDAARGPIAAPRVMRAEMAKHRAIHISRFEREGRDFYATPSWVTDALLRHVRFRGPVWEPCCGTGAMSAVLALHGYDVISTDIADHGFGTPGIDFLTCRSMPPHCCSIVTNPPYGDTGSHRGQTKSAAAMLDFVAHALTLAEMVRGQLALLVRLQWMAGQRAAALLTSASFAATIVLTRRIQWFDMGEQTNTAQHHHAWVVFDYEHPRGSPPRLLYS